MIKVYHHNQYNFINKCSMKQNIWKNMASGDKRFVEHMVIVPMLVHSKSVCDGVHCNIIVTMF